MLFCSFTCFENFCSLNLPALMFKTRKTDKCRDVGVMRVVIMMYTSAWHFHCLRRVRQKTITFECIEV